MVARLDTAHPVIPRPLAALLHFPSSQLFATAATSARSDAPRSGWVRVLLGSCG